MKITSILTQKKTAVSFEIFPPKEGAQFNTVTDAAAELGMCRPDFMSVTCRGGGGTVENTVSIASWVQDNTAVPALAHLTCVSSSRGQIALTAEHLRARGIENILALRGDLPEDTGTPLSGDYRYASDLIRHVRELGDFCVGAACYPEGHPESASAEKDMESLKRKTDEGCSFLTTQMFFDNGRFYDFLSRAEAAGIGVPVIAGIMPLTNGAQIRRMTALSSAFLPDKFRRMIETFDGNNAALKEAGIAYATEQIVDLITNGVRGIHIYTMNKPDVAKKIIANISEIKSALSLFPEEQAKTGGRA